MKFQFGKRLVAGLLCTVIAAVSFPTSAAVTSAEDSDDGTTQVYYNDFEENVGEFSGRGGVETLEISSEQVYDGDYALKVSDRTKSWHGPWIEVSGMLEAGVQYTVSAYVRTEWYNTITLSTDCTDSDDNRTYANLSSATCDGSGWVEFSDIKFSVPSDVESFYLYFECNDTATIYLDDFEIRTAQVYEPEDIAALKDVYADYFKIGTAVTATELASQSSKSLITKHFNSITAGNELKPDSVLDQFATLANYEATGDNTTMKISLSSASSILNFAAENNIPMRGHVLVWHQQTPLWFFKEGFDEDADWVDADTMTARLESYIKTVMETLAEEYPDVEFYAWDVVNEAASDSGTIRTAGSDSDNGQSPWVQVYGDQSYIIKAFEFARKYAPEGCKLYYNDYNEYITNKMNYIVSDILEPLIEEGLIDGMGMQSHLDISYPSISLYEKALQTYIDLGLDVQITELDATVSDNSDSSFKEQAQYYSDLFDLYVKYSDNISAVVLWGTTDDQSWRASKYPLLFNEDYTAKPAYYSIVDEIEYITTETTETTTMTTTTAETTETTESTDESTTESTASETETTISEETTTTEMTDSSETTTYTTTEDSTSDSSIDSTTSTTTTETTTTESTTDSTSDATTLMYGDVNLDGFVSLSDVVMLNRILSGSVEPNDKAKANADVNANDGIDADDALTLLKFQVQLIDYLPYSG